MSPHQTMLLLAVSEEMKELGAACGAGTITVAEQSGGDVVKANEISSLSLQIKHISALVCITEGERQCGQ